MTKKIALNWIDKNKKQLIGISDKIWEYAEVGLLEYESSRLLSNQIEKYGFEVKRGVAQMPTAFVASWGSGHPVLGIAGEFDALPGLSQKPIPFKEPLKKGAAGHGCGHNIIGTSGMAGAIAVKVTMEEMDLPGTIKFYGCPAEETIIGKIWLVRDGHFDGIDACFSHHPGQVNGANLSSTNANNSVKLHFYGVASHAAASPERGISALDAAELMNVGVNYMREHIIEKARIHYVIEKGGHEPNVVPPYARTWYYIRAPERAQVERIHKWVLKIADGADLMARTSHKVELLTGCYNRVPNRTLNELAVANMKEIGSPKHTEEELEFAKELTKSIPLEHKKEALQRFKHLDSDRRVDKFFDETVHVPSGEGVVMPFSTDVGDVSWLTPTMGFTTVSCVLGTPFHSWQFTAQAGMSIGHKSLIFASKVIAASAIDLMLKPDLLQKAQHEWKERLTGRVYKSPIPADLKPPRQLTQK